VKLNKSEYGLFMPKANPLHDSLHRAERLAKFCSSHFVENRFAHSRQSVTEILSSFIPS